MSGIKGCIFNMDGVIVDTSPYHYMAWRKMANELGFDLTEDQNEALRGRGRMDCLEQILEWGAVPFMTEAEKLWWASKKSSWYNALILNMKPGQTLPGALDFVHQVHEKGLSIALSSASQNARVVIESTGITSAFEVIIDGLQNLKQKPDPECYLLAAEALGIAPSECLVFDDAPLGIMAAIMGGFPVVGIGDSYNLNKANLVIPSLANQSFEDILNRINHELRPSYHGR
jgi:beta-phosphoglucomutase